MGSLFLISNRLYKLSKSICDINHLVSIAMGCNASHSLPVPSSSDSTHSVEKAPPAVPHELTTRKRLKRQQSEGDKRRTEVGRKKRTTKKRKRRMQRAKTCPGKVLSKSR